MIRRVGFLGLFLFASLSAKEKQIELFIDWMGQAKGQEIFQQRQTLAYQIRKGLLDRGWDIQSWEKEKYHPWTVSWKGVTGWQDCLWRLGWGLSKATPWEGSYWVFWGLGPQLKTVDWKRLPKEKLVLFAWEPPTVQPEAHDPKILSQFGRVFTWNDDLVDGKKFIKFYYPVLRKRISDIVPFAAKKFCTLIATRLTSKHPKQLYSEREKTIRFFEDKEGEFDLFGRNWEKRNYRNWRGPLGDKIGTLKGYKYCICYENTKDIKGYITEKIFDCFEAGCVPVYWGASNVTDWIPAECFIDRRRFRDEAELYAFLKSITPDQYAAYLEAAHAFLQSETAQLFSESHFVETFLNHLTMQNPSS